MTKETFIKKHFPRPLVQALQWIRHWYYTFKGFNHKLAQKGEFDYWKNFVERDRALRALLSFSGWKKERNFQYPPFTDSRMKYFFRDVVSFQAFCARMENKRCMEIGSGAVGDLALMPWIKERILVDPLLERYRKLQLGKIGNTLFSEDIECHSKEAEVFIPHLENTIDGCIICTNTLDHCRDPWLVLRNIAKYATVGCELLLWTDLWHLSGLNKEHRNITKNAALFEHNLIDLGFKITYSFSDVRQDHSTIEYGCIAIKR